MSPSRLSRFVILEHNHPFLHWDLLLEHGEVLQSWRLLGPVTAGAWIPSQSIPDHRRMYLSYEGPVSGNRGNVKRFTCGQFTSEPSDANPGPRTIRRFSFLECDFASTAYYREADLRAATSFSDQPEQLTNAFEPNGEWYFE